jgi:hypothetical protein
MSEGRLPQPRELEQVAIGSSYERRTLAAARVALRGTHSLRAEINEAA